MLGLQIKAIKVKKKRKKENLVIQEHHLQKEASPVRQAHLTSGKYSPCCKGCTMCLLRDTALSVRCKMAQAQTISCPSPQQFSQQTSTGVEVYSRRKTYMATERLKPLSVTCSVKKPTAITQRRLLRYIQAAQSSKNKTRLYKAEHDWSLVQLLSL